MTDSHSGSDYETKDVSKLIRLLDKIDDSNNVFKCYLLPDTDQVYACKKIVLIEKEPNKPNRGRSCGLNFKAIRKLVHPNIIKHHKVLFYDHAVLIVMDFYPSGSVNELIVSRGRPLTLKLCKVWFAQILGAVSYIHFKGIAHRNLKLSVMIISSVEMVMLSGFGNHCLAYKPDADIMRTTVVGDIQYQAPEMHSLCAQIWPYDAKASDVYALGVSLFKMLNVQPPFDVELYASDPIMFIMKQRNRDYQFNPQYESNITSRMKKLISLLLEPLPGIRITASTALVHEALVPE